MKRISLYILLSFFLFSCANDDNEPEIACDLIDAISSNLFIELVNAEGENLIENGTYNPNNITIDFNGNTFTGVITGVEGIQNFVTVGVSGNNGDNTFEISLSDMETDTLVLDLTRMETEGPCAQFVFQLNSAIYNGVSRELQDFGGDFLITIVKE
ncbi:hypothetical protein GCM10011344_25720 [Dokdonia pacifica]|uniref:Uncharacterized protein n=1 Tax=Dokdonia pacifica TaxID=1627892 RepID=A0A238WSA8_9FLAO|nr:hypothetical protein [Dokdonia pacifica]GGG23795.1 hypothetical protein GCM10011344_25720 [Dokdonia pacifica]SNR49415.1 hypothetical protein SAMN06265376_1011429 [Dokdonia pacifica]